MRRDPEAARRFFTAHRSCRLLNLFSVRLNAKQEVRRPELKPKSSDFDLSRADMPAEP